MELFMVYSFQMDAILVIFFQNIHTITILAEIIDMTTTRRFIDGAWIHPVIYV